LFGHLSAKHPHTVEKEFVLMHSRYNIYFKLHVQGRINYYPRSQVVRPCFKSLEDASNPTWHFITEIRSVENLRKQHDRKQLQQKAGSPGRPLSGNARR